MSETSAPRKLATIVALDVAGYSARTEADEAKTMSEVAALRAVIERIAKTHAGRVFNTAGDGFMLEFGSSLAAVEAAFELAEKCNPKVRVGVHLGDVVVQPNGDLLGHGVNVAARLMAQAEPGSALVSGTVRQTIRGPLADRLVTRGPLKLDKMAETIEAFALGATAMTIVAQPKSVEPLLAVLPFDNLSSDPELQFFSDGVSEEILHTVARAEGLKVIGKASSFQFRGVDKVVRKVVSELHATHVLDGSVRRVGNHVRLSAQLVEASSQTTLWSERYDRDLTDVFQLQDEIAAAIAQNLQTRFKANARPSIDPAVYDLYLQARAALTRDWSPIDLQASQTVLEQVVARAPDFAAAWGLLAAMRVVLLPNDRDCIGEPAHRAVSAAVDRALSLDRDCADAIGASVGLLPAFAGYAEKLRVTQRAIELAPNDTTAMSLRAFALASVGLIRESLDAHCRSVQTDPLQSWPHAQYAMALYAAGRTDDALRTMGQAAERFPDAPWVWLSHVVLLAHLGLNDSGRRGQVIAKLDGANLPAVDGAIGSYLASSRMALRKLLDIIELPSAEREQALEPLLVTGPDRAIVARASTPVLTTAVNTFVCEFAAALGHQDIAFDRLFAALDTGQPISSGGGARWFTSRAFFWLPGSAMRRDRRFPRLCARLGLVDYWRTSGHWPDCASEVPYDFKAECEKAAREMAKT